MSRLINSSIKAEKLFLNMAKKLSANMPFHLLEIFKELDIRNIGHFTAQDLKDLIDIHVREKTILLSETEELIKRFDKMRKGKVSYSDFSNTIIALVKEDNVEILV